MNMATILRHTANVFVAATVVKLLTADLKEEISHDSASVREKASRLVQKAPYRAAGLTAAAAALTGFMVVRARAHRTIPTRF